VTSLHSIYRQAESLMLTQNSLNYYFASGRGAKYCDQRVCMSVCPSVRTSQKRHVHTSWNFLRLLIVLWSWTRGSLLWRQLGTLRASVFLWTTSCFHIMGPMGQNWRRRYVSSSSPGCGTGGEVLCVRLVWCKRAKTCDNMIIGCSQTGCRVPV